MKIDINSIGYRWKGVYSPYTSYSERDVVFKQGGAYVQRNGTMVPFALGQRDVVTPGAILTGGDEKFGIYGTVLHSNGVSTVDFRFMGERNGTVATSLMKPIDSGSWSTAAYNCQAIMNSGVVRAWGANDSGRNGLGSSDNPSHKPSTVPFPVGTPPIKEIKAGWIATYYIDASGGLWVTGINNDNQQGTGNNNRIPVKLNGYGALPLNAKVTKIVTSYDYYANRSIGCLTEDGRVYVWGANNYGQLGLGNTTAQTTPVLLPLSVTLPMKDLYFSAGTYGVGGFITTTGQLYACGHDRSGHGYTTSIPTLLAPWDDGATVKLFKCSESDNHAIGDPQYMHRQLVVLDNGELWIWGSDAGQVTDGQTDNNNVPKRVLTGVKDAWSWSGGYSRCIALMQDGTVKAVGAENYRINGNVAGSNTTVWATIGNSFLTNVTKILAIGGTYGTTALALRSDGKAVGWGAGGQGSHGNGRVDEINLPDTFVMLDRNIIDIGMSGHCSGGDYLLTSYFLTSDGSVYASGSGSSYMNGLFENNSVSIPKKIIF